MIELSQYNSQELRELKKQIDNVLEGRRRDKAKKAQQELKEVAERYGFNLNELVAKQSTSQPRRRGKAPAQFRHPEDDSKTWSGRGRKPVWVKEWEAAGRSLEGLRIR